MEWIAQNWLWIALAVGMLFVMRRMGCGMGHAHGRQEAQPRSDAGPVDPVSHHAVRIDGAAASSVYRGQTYYFESRANQDRFESNPEQFVTADATRDHVHADGAAGTPRRRHRHGC